MSYLWIFMVSKATSLIIWGTIVFLIFGLAGVCVALILMYVVVMHTASSGSSYIMNLGYSNAWLLLLIATAGILTLLGLIAVCVMYRRSISVAIGLIFETTTAFFVMPHMSFVPLVEFIVFIIFTVFGMLVYTLTSTVGVFATSDVDYTVNNVRYTTIAKKFVVTGGTYFIQAYTSFWMILTAYIIFCIGKASISATIYDWYFTRDKKTSQCSHHFRGFYKCSDFISDRSSTRCFALSR